MISIGNLTKLEVSVEGKAYSFICDQSSPVSHAKEAILKFLAHCMDIEKSVASQQKSEEAPAAQPEEIKQE